MIVSKYRQVVLDAFNEVDGYYNHQKPYGYADYIDGMGHIGVLVGAALMVGDAELAEKGERYLKTLLAVGKDARNYAPLQSKPDWVASTTMPGFYYIQKAQDFAGPAGLNFAVRCGAQTGNPFDIESKAKMLVSLGWLFGYAVKYVSALKQHINSMWLAHLVLCRKPAESMMWMCEENPFYSYIAGKKCSVEHPSLCRFINGDSKTEKQVVPLKNAKPTAWIFRRDPFESYFDADQSGRGPIAYTPTAFVVADYLQSTL
jgi:hypothetical protein